MTNTIPERAWTLGLTFLTFPVACLVLCCVAFAVGIPVTSFQFWLGIAAASIFLLVRGFKLSLGRKSIFSLLAVFLLGILVSVIFSSLTNDNSWDGLTYHQEYVILLHDGWNPFREPVRADNFFISSKWVRDAAYTKEFEVLASLVYATTGLIETGKCFNIIALIQSALLSYSFFIRIAGNSASARWWPACAATLMTLNPVVLSQLNSYYVDGILCSAMMSWLCALGILLIDRKLKSAWYALALTTICLVGLKMYSLAFLGVAGILAAIAIVRFTSSWRCGLQFISFLALVTVVATALAFNPYIISARPGAQPYVTALSAAYDLGKETDRFQQPQGLISYKNRLQRLALSLFSEATNDTNQNIKELSDPQNPPKPLKIQFPFEISLKDLSVLSLSCEPRISGFGPWFGEIMVLSICYFLLSFYWQSKLELKVEKMRQERQAVLWLAGIVIATVVIHPVCWWARYVPQLWCFPILLCVVTLIGEPQKKTSGAAVLIASLIALNSFLTYTPYLVRCILWELHFRKEIQAIKEDCQSSGKPVSVYYPRWVWPVQSIIVRLKENQIPFELTQVAPPEGARQYKVFLLPLKIYQTTKP